MQLKKKRLLKIATVAIALVTALAAASSCPAKTKTSMNEKEMKANKFGKIYVSDTKAKTMQITGRSVKKIDLSKWKLDGSLAYMHGMWYLAKTTKSVKAKAADGGKSVRVGSGTQVIITFYPSPKGTATCRLKSGRSVKISGKNLRTLKYVYNSSSRYADAQVEEWVNSRKITSGSKYLFFASKFNQRAWIMEKTKDGWRCKYVVPISTGAYTNYGRPNDLYGFNSCSINTHYVNKKGFGRGISYASKAGGNQIHTTNRTLRPGTHGCIAMKRKDYNFVYNYLPYGTRVVLF